MARLKIKKHFSFAFLGDEWKDGYMNFEAFSANDIGSQAGLTNIDPKNPDPKAVQEGFNSMIERLKTRFIDGKMPTEEGTLEDITKEELGTLPIDIIQEAISFLSQSQAPTSPTQ